jgi:hypothetical protein
MAIQNDTRQLLRTGFTLFFAGALALLLMFTVFGGITDHGPHTNAGWLALIAAIGCLPLSILTLILAFAKVLGDRHK